MDINTQIIILIILLALSAFFAGAETAIISISELKLKHLVKKKKKSFLILQKLKNKPHKTIITILIGNNTVNILAASMATSLAIDMFESNAVGIATGIMTIITLSGLNIFIIIGGIIVAAVVMILVMILGVSNEYN